MKIKTLLQKSREIWGEEKLSLSQIIVRMGKVFGDICRWERKAEKDSKIYPQFKKMILRWFCGRIFKIKKNEYRF